MTPSESNAESASTIINWTLYDDRSGRIHPHEPLERYAPGGFHPVALGDTFKDGRYIVRHKLGYGGFSTVWLASDEQNQGSAHRYVAIKIKSSSSSEMDISAGNVTFTCHSLLNDEDDDLLDLVSEVYTANPWPDKLLPPHLPKQLVQTMKWSNWEDETEEDIRLVDWGSAFPVGETLPVEAMAQPIDLRSPETFFIGKFDYRHDIWRAGPPFFVFLPDSYFYLLRMREKLGPLPESWLPNLAELRKESVYAERDDGREDPDTGESELICDTFEPRRQTIIAEFTSGDEKYDEPDEHTDFDFEALKSLQRTIMALLQYQPSDRVTVKDAMEMIEWVDNRREKEGGDNIES
ncbi:hypothetical protein diail_11702 [Diaporthe ilicicola]|nr:hypothetical protein diail_11702 [Diaporthe ilicicola]